MLKRVLSACAVGLMAGWFVPVSVAGPTSVRAVDAPLEAREMRAWLTRIHRAASHQNFQGTFVVSAGGTVSSSRIAHFCVGPSQFERIESLDGPRRSVYRHDDVVTTLWPKRKEALVEQRNLVSSFPALLQAGDDRIAAFYEARGQEGARLAGREADVLLLRPKDALRYGYRLWADKETGLLLRVEVQGEHGEVLESSAFSDLTIGGKAQPETVLQPMKRLEGYRVQRPTLTARRLDAEGWTLRQGVPGFEQVSAVKRPLGGTAGDAADAPIEVLQAIYSDGLTYVSVFIEPYDAARHPRAMHTAVGATHTLMRRHGEWWVTLVGDVPGVTLKRFADEMEYRR